MAKNNAFQNRIGMTLLSGLLAAVGYAGLSALSARHLLKPRRRFAYGVTPGLYGLEFRDVFFPARGGDTTISGWFIPCPGSRRAVVLVHGKDVSRAMEFAGRFLEVAQGLYRRGFSVLMIDLRGHGLSGPGRFTFGGDERRDVLGAVDWLLQEGYSPGAVGVLGVSLGAASCLSAAAEEPAIGAVVADSGYAEFKPLVRSNWRSQSGMPDALLPGVLQAARWMYGFNDARAHPAAEVGRMRGALLLIHGDADRLVPAEHAAQLALAQPRAEVWIVPGAIHAGCYNADPTAYLQRVGRFFDEKLAAAGGEQISMG